MGVALLGLMAWRLISAHEETAKAKTPAAAAAGRAVPVSVATVEQKDIPIYLEGLGTVTALATVTMRAQVDGRLVKVAFVEGQAVKKGDLLAQVDPRPFAVALQQAEGALERDRANLKNTQLDLTRYQELRGKNLIPAQQVDTQVALVAQAEGTVVMDEATVNNAKLNVEYARIVSPVDGVTGIRQVDQGNLVHATDTSGIVVLTQLDPISVIFTLPQDDLPRVSEAMSKGELQVDAFNRDGSKKLATGKVTVVDNQINASTATMRVRAQFPNPDHSLWPNLFVKARLLLSVEKGATVIPNASVQRGPKGTYVYIAQADNTAGLRTVEVSDTEGQLALIKDGLKAGEKVVSEGQNQLTPGSKIQVGSGKQ